MKKLLLALPLVLALAFAAGPLAAHAVGESCPSGNDGECPGSEECDTNQQPYLCVNPDTGQGAGNLGPGAACASDGQCSGNLACIHGVCQYDPSLEDQGTAGPGGVCSNNDQCGGGQTCSIPAGQTSGTCSGSTGGASAGGGSGFVPLAPIPGLTSAQSNVTSSTIAGFLNNLYKYLIGLAATLAVIVIIWGGLEIAGESVTKKASGKEKIQNAVLGLVLVLSPVLVFTIINPAILNLSLSLQPLSTQAPSTPSSVPVQPGQTTPLGGTADGHIKLGDTICPSNQVSSCGAAQQACDKKNDLGTSAVYDYTCVKQDGSQDPSAPTNINGNLTACPSGDYVAVTCSTNTEGPGGGHSI
ncbi:MAG TPA: pilin [Candidatus Paceibacterota bacterium]|nr:pilin [Candidatus Paceibacterota bacterium]